MLIIIEDIDFVTSHTRVRVSGDIKARDARRLTSFTNKCNEFKLTNIIIHVSENITEKSLVFLSGLPASHNVSIVNDNNYDSADDARVKKSSMFSYKVINPLLKDAPNNHEYSFSVSNLKTATEEMQAVISLISEAMDIDDKTYYRLKLCIYELTANSIEHGIFASAHPMISLSTKFSDKSVFICFTDNAKEFIPIASQTADIKEKIRAKNTRGYGLIIMNCLTKDLQFNRIENVNQTTFKIKRPDEQSDSKQRRLQMEQFSIKLASCDIEDAMIVKLNGSVDSMTTQRVEDQLISLMDNKTKYIVMDFSEVSFISSSGIGILLGTISTLREDGGDLILMKMPAQIAEIFDILNISNYFLTIDSIDELKNSIHSKT